MHGIPGHNRTTAAKGTYTVRHQVRTAMQHADMLDGHPETVSADLRHRRLMPLPRRGNAKIHGNMLGTVDDHARAFIGPQTGPLHEAAHANAVVLALYTHSLQGFERVVVDLV